MTNLQRRLKKLEAYLTDPSGLVPHTQKWLEYWDRQFNLFLTGQHPNALRNCSVEVLHTVMTRVDNPASLAGSSGFQLVARLRNPANVAFASR